MFRSCHAPPFQEGVIIRQTGWHLRYFRDPAVGSQWRERWYIRVKAAVQVPQAVFVDRLIQNSLVYSLKGAVKAGSFRQLGKSLKDLPAVAVLTAVQISLHVLRHHPVDPAVSQRPWFTGDIFEIWQPFHALQVLVITAVQSPVCHHRMVFKIHDFNEFGADAKPDLLLRQSRRG